MNSSKVLIIDDDQNILHGYRRMLGRRYQIEIADGPREGLHKALSDNEYAVIVCDLHMPKIDGLRLMMKVRELSPHTVRILLTGSLDHTNALDAINDGTVFRYLTKPCRIEVLSRCIDEALALYRQTLWAEQVRSKTLVGLVRLMSELFAVHEPQLCGSVPRVHAIVSQIARRLDLKDVWEFELAALLSQLGLWGLPPALRTCLAQGLELKAAHEDMFSQHPQRAATYLEGLEHLGDTPKMISHSTRPLTEIGSGYLQDAPRWVVGAQLIKLASDFERERNIHGNAQTALQILAHKASDYFSDMLQCLTEIVSEECASKTALAFDKLKAGMILAEDLVSRQGQVLITRGQVVTPATIGFLNHRREFGFDLPALANVQNDSFLAKP